MAKEKRLGGRYILSSIYFRSIIAASISLALIAAIVLFFTTNLSRSLLIGQMRSQAESIIVSVNQVVGESIVVGDFSTTVDHCTKVVQGRPLVEYIVVVRKEGEAFVHTKQGWHTGELEDFWRPLVKNHLFEGVFLNSELVEKKRVFHLTDKLQYSGIDAGWLHVGFSLKQFQANISEVQKQIIKISAACLAIMLILVFFYIGSLVKPVILLKNVVQRIEGGDFTKRAKNQNNKKICR